LSMGDLGVGMEEDRPWFAGPLSNPDPDAIRVETWAESEETGREVLNCVYPTLDSEEKRKDVIEFVQKLIRFNLRLEVVHFFIYNFDICVFFFFYIYNCMLMCLALSISSI
jgi:hypothetical protein